MVPRIRQVQIQNYKSIERAVVDLDPFTAFVGPNGAGKSNFVDALTFVQDCLRSGIEMPLAHRGGSRIVPRWILSDEPRVGFRLILDLTAGGEADYAFELSLSASRFRVTRERCTIRLADREAMFEIADGRFIHPISGIRPKIEADRLALFAASAVEEFRPVYDFLLDMKFYSIEPRGMTSVLTPDGAEALSFTGSNAAAILRLLEENSPELAGRIVELLAQVVHGIVTVRARTQNGRVTLEFRQDFGAGEPATFEAFEMSEGTLRVLGLLLAIYQSSRASLLAIEDPEATVHPAVAELVVQVLLDATYKRQVLITTHSPDILDAKELSDDQIRVVTAQHGRTIIASLSEASRKAVREHLYTPGELLRLDELSQDLDAARNNSQHLDLFGGNPAPVHS